MTDTAQYTYGKANKAASYIIQLLQPHCQRIHLAGSLRRMRPQVKDIEIVCIPKKEVKQSGLFSDIKEEITDRNFIEALATITDAIIRGSAEGRYMQIKTNSKLCPDIYLDLFMPQPEDYYRIYAIRTGSAAYAQKVIAAAWKRKGWAGVKELGLRRRDQCDVKTDSQGKETFILKKDLVSITLPPAWKSEGEFFRWLDLAYTDPEYREYEKPLNELQ